MSPSPPLVCSADRHNAGLAVMRGQPAIGVHPPTTPRQRLHDPSPRVRQPLPGVLLPGLPPHAASPRSNNMHIASFQLAPLEKGGWLTCRRGGNTLPLHQRLEAAGSSSVLTLAGVLGASRALSIELTRMVAKGVPTATTLANICAICSETMGADEVSLLTAQRLDGMRTTTADGGRLDGGGAFLREPHFEKACGALTAGSPLCNRLSAALSHEMISAAENSISLNLHGDMSGQLQRPVARDQRHVRGQTRHDLIPTRRDLFNHMMHVARPLRRRAHAQGELP